MSRKKSLNSVAVALRSYWDTLVGKPEELTRQNRGFNVVSIFVFLLLAVLIPLDWYLGLTEIALALLVTEAMLVVMYCLSRCRGLYQTGLQVYVGWSYLLITFVFFYNGGSAGPALYFFLLTYQLVIVFTSGRLQRVGTVLHLVFPVGLLALEYINPAVVLVGYPSENDRFIDLVTSLPIIVICVFLTTRYLRRAYEREKAAAEARAKLIEQQSERINEQNRLLQEANSEKLALISILGHDLRNPLNAITGTLEILSKEQLPPDQERELRADLWVAARNTSGLLDNVLSWVLGQVEGINPLFTAVEPMTIINRVLGVQRFIAEKKGIAIGVESTTDARMYADVEMLELIVRNLVSNAIKFTAQGGRVTVGVTEDRERQECTVFVRDNGVGMTGEDVKEIFNGQIQSTYGTESEKGIGLGLFLCRELIRRLDGSIKVESVADRGSTFYLTLPIAHAMVPDDKDTAVLADGEAYL